MKIQKVKLSDIFPYYNNPRDNSRAVEPVMESLKKFGFIKPIMVDENMVIICGHTRYIAAFQAGCEYVPIIVSDMPEEQAKRFRILDNKIAEKSQFDENELIEELRKMKAPEEMQAFFFEDVKSMLNFSFSQFENQVQSVGGFTPNEDYGAFENIVTPAENYDTSNRASHIEGKGSLDEQQAPTEEQAEDSEFEDPAKDLFVAKHRTDGTVYMKVVCPYCGNIEEIELD